MIRHETVGNEHSSCILMQWFRASPRVMLTKRQNQDHHRHDSGLHYPRLLVLLVELCSTRVSGAGGGRFTDSPTYISFYCAIQWWFFLLWCGRRDPIRCYGWWWGMYKVFIYDTTPCVLMVRLCRIRDRFAAATSPRFEMQEEAISKAGIN